LVADDPVIFAGSGILSVTDDGHSVVDAVGGACGIVEDSRSGVQLKFREIGLEKN